MTQNADTYSTTSSLFRGPEYKEMLENKKKNFENPVAAEEVERVREWTKTAEYREKNFAREALTVNPAKACQPLGAVFAAVGFESTLPFVHGSQGCVAYYRSHFLAPLQGADLLRLLVDDRGRGGVRRPQQHGRRPRQRLQPVQAEDDRVSTTCMAEVIGDDLNAFIKTAKEKGSVPQEFDVPFAHTPAFVGSHITGYDNVMKGIIEHFWDGKAGTAPKLERVPNEKINFIGGFDGYTVGNLREIKRIFN
jgi:nitrogenase molybdenum-iron protein beta chain